jgi:hypothetical protein
MDYDDPPEAKIRDWFQRLYEATIRLIDAENDWDEAFKQLEALGLETEYIAEVGARYRKDLA